MYWNKSGSLAKVENFLTYHQLIDILSIDGIYSLGGDYSITKYTIKKERCHCFSE